jgi:hypothetical protein
MNDVMVLEHRPKFQWQWLRPQQIVLTVEAKFALLTDLQLRRLQLEQQMLKQVGERPTHHIYECPGAHSIAACSHPKCFPRDKAKAARRGLGVRSQSLPRNYRLRLGCGLRFETNTENPKNSLALPARMKVSCIESWCNETSKSAPLEAFALSRSDKFVPRASTSITRCPAWVNAFKMCLVIRLLN